MKELLEFIKIHYLPITIIALILLFAFVGCLSDKLIRKDVKFKRKKILWK